MMTYFRSMSSRWPTLGRAPWRIAAVVLVATLASGCASGPGATSRDPLEPFNRGVSRFNEDVDKAVLKPVANTYREVTPRLVRVGIGNFFGNLSDVWSFVNNVLQLKIQNAAETFMRVNVNTFFGLGGLIDVASEMNIERHSEDFGQTLGRWGVPAGPYVVLPLLGPSTLRDALALTVDGRGDYVQQISPVASRNSLYVLRGVDLRAQLLRAGEVLDEAALDKYTFTRDVYLQRRRAEVFDGNVPEPEAEAAPPVK